ncbi:hypothetical protein BS47DRAFT_1244612, partial [Hydnum rufescens UP504]
ILPALSLNGIIHVEVKEGSYDHESFRDFIEHLLEEMNPFPAKNSIIVLDNASIHRSPEIRELVEE